MDEQLNNEAPFTVEGGSSNKGIKPSNVSKESWDLYNKFYNFAKDKGDIHPEVFATQAALESNWFKKPLGKNNYFGRRASKYEPSTKVNNTRYRDYADINDSLNERFNNYSTQYQDLSTAREAVRRLRDYPSDRNYDIELNDLMTKLNINVNTPKTNTTLPEEIQAANDVFNPEENQQIQEPNVNFEQSVESVPVQEDLNTTYTNVPLNSNYGQDLKTQTDNNLLQQTNNLVSNLQLNNPRNSFANGGEIDPPDKTFQNNKNWLLNWYKNRVIPNEQFNKDYQKDKDKYLERITNLKDPLYLDKFDDNETQGMYDRTTDQVQLLKSADPLTGTHEITHYIDNMPGQRDSDTNAYLNIKKNILPIDKIDNKWVRDNYGYLSNFEEVLGRINPYRQKYDLKPDQKITPELIKANREKYNAGTNYELNEDQLYKLFNDEGLSDVLNSVVLNNTNNNMNIAAYGGNVQTSSVDAGLNEFNVGGTHEQNPYGGIPLGTGANGKLNTVEQGETSHLIDNKKFIFSHRIRI